MNKYLVKIAKQTEEDKLARRAAGGTLIGVGAGVINHDYHAGNLTGRETLYHGTSSQRAADIREHGLKPNIKGVSNVVDERLHRANHNRVFMTKNRLYAGQYSHQQSAIESGKVHSAASLNQFQNSAEHHLGSINESFGEGVVRGDVPTWKHEYRKTRNPEIKMQFDAIDRDILAAARPGGRKGAKRAVYNLFHKNVHTFHNSEGVSPEYLRGSKYKPNSFSEVKDFVKAKPNRFLKGVSRAIIGAGAIGAGAKFVKDSFKE